MRRVEEVTVLEPVPNLRMEIKIQTRKLAEQLDGLVVISNRSVYLVVKKADENMPAV